MGLFRILSIIFIIGMIPDAFGVGDSLVPMDTEEVVVFGPCDVGGIEEGPAPILSEHINDLPNEILLHIFSFLSEEEKMKASRVCMLWKTLNPRRLDIRHLKRVDDKSLVMEIALKFGEEAEHLETLLLPTLDLDESEKDEGNYAWNPVQRYMCFCELGKTCPNLKNLFVQRIDFRELNSLLKHLPSLEKLSLQQVECSFLIDLRGFCPLQNLQFLEVPGEMKGLPIFIENLPSLKHLKYNKRVVHEKMPLPEGLVVEGIEWLPDDYF